MRTFSYEEFIDFIENWVSWEDPFVYDYGGIIAVLGAALSHLCKSGVDDELRDLADRLEHDEIEMLVKLASYVSDDREERE